MTKSRRKHAFKINEYVVYPTHGVGQVILIEEQEIDGEVMEFFVVNFVRDKMTLRVPTGKAIQTGMRGVSDQATLDYVFETLSARARVKRAMWSRRAQEYEQKINSGDLILIAEVVRDLNRGDDQREQSYSERQLYEAAFERLMREVAIASYKGDEKVATAEIAAILEARNK